MALTKHLFLIVAVAVIAAAAAPEKKVEVAKSADGDDSSTMDLNVAADTSPMTEASGSALATEGNLGPQATYHLRRYHYHWGSNNYNRNDCLINGILIRHGQVRSISHINPCWKKLCWNGHLRDQEDGCYDAGRCFPINQEYRLNCATKSEALRLVSPTPRVTFSDNAAL